jgi:hypothetical protein
MMTAAITDPVTINMVPVKLEALPMMILAIKADHMEAPANKVDRTVAPATTRTGLATRAADLANMAPARAVV